MDIRECKSFILWPTCPHILVEGRIASSEVASFYSWKACMTAESRTLNQMESVGWVRQSSPFAVVEFFSFLTHRVILYSNVAKFLLLLWRFPIWQLSNLCTSSLRNKHKWLEPLKMAITIIFFFVGLNGGHGRDPFSDPKVSQKQISVGWSWYSPLMHSRLTRFFFGCTP